MARTRRKRSRRSRLARLVRRIAVGLVVLVCLMAVIAGAAFFVEVTAALPPVDQLATYRPPTATQVFADDGSLIGEFFVEKRYLVPIDRIPAHVRQAFVAAEDDRFYEHGGIDVTSIVRAALNNVLGGGPLQGGSTITQQVVKSLLLTPRKSYERKLKEIVLALRLERQLSKEEILSLYLNHIYLGAGAHGVAAAAQAYFGKSVQELNLAEASLLAGLPQAPSRYSPTRHWRRAKARQRYVLDRMVEAKFITPDERAASLRQPIALASRRGSYIAAPYYVEHVRRLLEERYGPDTVPHLGLRVHTAANVAMTAAAEDVLRAALAERDRLAGGSGQPLRHLSAAEARDLVAAQRRDLGGRLEVGKAYEGVVVATRRQIVLQVGDAQGPLETAVNRAHPGVNVQPGDVLRVIAAGTAVDGSHRFQLDPQPLVQGALAAVDPRTGYVKAMVGGYDFRRSQFNRVTQAMRQPGSAFKPLVYAAALDRGFTPASIIVDSPVSFPDSHGLWTPQNYEQRFFGPTTLRDALAFSRNVVTVKLASRLGMKYLIRHLRQMGISGPLAPNLSIALGSSEVTPLELIAAYGVFANQGRHVAPTFITRIVDEEGNAVFEAHPEMRQAIPVTTAYQITSMLQDVIRRGTGRRASALGRPAAGKTGTTNDLNDAWFIGYTPQLLAGVWVGYDEKRSLGYKATGGRVAAPIWLSFMERALEGAPILDFAVPRDVLLLPVNPRTGERAAAGDPAARMEVFRPGTEPTTISASLTAPDTAADVAAREFFRNED